MYCRVRLCAACQRSLRFLSAFSRDLFGLLERLRDGDGVGVALRRRRRVERDGEREVERLRLPRLLRLLPLPLPLSLSLSLPLLDSLELSCRLRLVRRSTAGLPAAALGCAAAEGGCTARSFTTATTDAASFSCVAVVSFFSPSSSFFSSAGGGVRVLSFSSPCSFLRGLMERDGAAERSNSAARGGGLALRLWLRPRRSTASSSTFRSAAGRGTGASFGSTLTRTGERLSSRLLFLRSSRRRPRLSSLPLLLALRLRLRLSRRLRRLRWLRGGLRSRLSLRLGLRRPRGERRLICPSSSLEALRLSSLALLLLLRFSRRSRLGLSLLSALLLLRSRLADLDRSRLSRLPILRRSPSLSRSLALALVRSSSSLALRLLCSSSSSGLTWSSHLPPPTRRAAPLSSLSLSRSAFRLSRSSGSSTLKPSPTSYPARMPNAFLILSSSPAFSALPPSPPPPPLPSPPDPTPPPPTPSPLSSLFNSTALISVTFASTSSSPTPLSCSCSANASSCASTRRLRSCRRREGWGGRGGGRVEEEWEEWGRVRGLVVRM